MEPEKSIALRPRFEVESKNSVEKILERAKTLKSELKSDYQIKIIDEHLYFYFSKEKRKYYSPFLHLELEAEEGKTKPAPDIDSAPPAIIKLDSPARIEL